MNPYPNPRVGFPCRARPDGEQQTPSVKMKMPKDGARVRSFSKEDVSEAEHDQMCQTSRATNQSNDSQTPPQ